MALKLRPLPLLLLNKCLLLQRAGSNMVPFNFALETNNLGQIFDLYLALLLLIHLGLIFIVDKTRSTLVIGGFFHTQHIVEFGLPFMTLYQVFLQGSDLGLGSSISSTWLVTTQVLEEVEASLLEQQGKENNSSQDVAIL
jgi:hypothetical protein